MYCIDGKSLKTAEQMADYLVEISGTYIESDYRDWGNGLSLMEYTSVVRDGMRLDLEAMENGDVLTFYSTEVWKKES